LLLLLLLLCCRGGVVECSTDRDGVVREDRFDHGATVEEL